MSNKKSRASYEIKSTNLSLISFTLKDTNLKAISIELEKQFGTKSNYFENEPVIIDLNQINAVEQPIDFPHLISLLSKLQMRPFAVSGGSAEQFNAALQAGLLIAPESQIMSSEPVIIGAGKEERTQKVTGEMQSNDESPATLAQPNEQINLTENMMRKTVVLDKPLRSGQQVYAREADLIVTSLVSYGAEVIADGNIHVYAPLRGRAIAGARGDTSARIYATCFEPELYSIAGVFQTTENQLPASLLTKAVCVHLENDSLLVNPI